MPLSINKGNLRRPQRLHICIEACMAFGMLEAYYVLLTANSPYESYCAILKLGQSKGASLTKVKASEVATLIQQGTTCMLQSHCHLIPHAQPGCSRKNLSRGARSSGPVCKCGARHNISHARKQQAPRRAGASGCGHVHYSQ